MDLSTIVTAMTAVLGTGAATEGIRWIRGRSSKRALELKAEAAVLDAARKWNKELFAQVDRLQSRCEDLEVVEHALDDLRHRYRVLSAQHQKCEETERQLRSVVSALEHDVIVLRGRVAELETKHP